MKAMILAAGLGTRLRPLTLTTPKVLLPLRGQPLIARSLNQLAQHGFTDVIINLHHLGEKIEKLLGNGKQFGLKISYTHEDKILGTGGGIKNASDLFDNSTVLIMNGDILMNLDLKEFVKFHQEKGGIATMVIRPRAAKSEHTPLQVNNEHRILKIEKGLKDPNFMYTGVQIIEPKLISYLPKGNSCIVRQGYLPALEQGEKIYGYRYDGYWNDVGTPKRYEEAQKNLQT
jgi:NDP-sugar pyrophosphorylase family protein